MNQKSQIGISIPVANEEETIESFTNALIKEAKTLRINAHYYFVIDNVSKDSTYKILSRLSKKYKNVILIYEPKNKNVVDAYLRGYKEAIQDKCDFIIDMDCGFSHLPNELYKFIDGFNEGYDCVFGIRPLWSPIYAVPLNRRIFSLGGTILSNVLLGMHYKDTTSGYVGYTNRAIKQLIKKPLNSKGHFWHTEMRYRAKKLKYKEVFITYTAPSDRVSNKILGNSFSILFYLFRQKLGFK